MVGALGAEVDRLETEIQELMPGIRHIDLVRQQPPPASSCRSSGMVYTCHIDLVFRSNVSVLLASLLA